ncbi:MAG: hypothetical protein AAF202_04260 [Pseudomonadota bacterium]
MACKEPAVFLARKLEWPVLAISALIFVFCSTAQSTTSDLLLVPAVEVTAQNNCHNELSSQLLQKRVPELIKSGMISGSGKIHYASLKDLIEGQVAESSPEAVKHLVKKLKGAQQDVNLDPVFKSAINYLLNKVDLSQVAVGVTGEGLQFAGHALGFLNMALSQPGHMFLPNSTDADLTKHLAEEAERMSYSDAIMRPTDIYILGHRDHLEEQLRNPDLAILFLLHEILHYVDTHRYLSAIKRGIGLPPYLMPIGYSERVTLYSFSWFTVMMEIRAYLALYREGNRLGLFDQLMTQGYMQSFNQTLERAVSGADENANALRQLGLLVPRQQVAPGVGPAEAMSFQRVVEFDEELERVFSALN